MKNKAHLKKEIYKDALSKNRKERNSAKMTIGDKLTPCFYDSLPKYSVVSYKKHSLNSSKFLTYYQQNYKMYITSRIFISLYFCLSLYCVNSLVFENIKCFC